MKRDAIDLTIRGVATAITAQAGKWRKAVEGNVRAIAVYLRVGLLLHAITLLEVAFLAAIATRFPLLEAGSWTETLLNAMVLGFSASLPVLSQLDARSRYQSYKRVKAQFLRFGFDTRILKPLLKSRCQRDAAWVAADESGYGTLCSNFYRSRGYRWYHLFPDFLFSNPRFLISRHFWQSTFFMQTYRPRRNSCELPNQTIERKEVIIRNNPL